MRSKSASGFVDEIDKSHLYLQKYLRRLITLKGAEDYIATNKGTTYKTKYGMSIKIMSSYTWSLHQKASLESQRTYKDRYRTCKLDEHQCITDEFCAIFKKNRRNH